MNLLDELIQNRVRSYLKSRGTDPDHVLVSPVLAKHIFLLLEEKDSYPDDEEGT